MKSFKRLFLMVRHFYSAASSLARLLSEAQMFVDDNEEHVVRVRNVFEFERRPDGIMRCNFIGTYYQTLPDMRHWIVRRYRANEAGDKLVLF